MSAETDGDTAVTGRLRAARSAIDAGRHGEGLALLRRIAVADDVADVERDEARVAAMQLAARMYDLATMVELRDLGPAGTRGHDRSITLLGLVAAALDGSPDAAQRLIAEVNGRLDGHVPADELRMIAESLALAIARSGRGEEFFEVLLRAAGMARELGEPGLVTSLLVAEAAFRSRSNLGAARVAAQRAVDIAAAEDDLRSLPFALAQLATAQASLGDDAFAAAADRLESFGAPAAVLVADFARAMYALTIGDEQRAYDQFWRIDDRFSGDLTAPVSWHADFVDVAIRRGDLAAASRVAASLGVTAAACSIPWLTAAVGRVNGALASDADIAAQSFDDAVAAYEEHGYSIAAARTLLSHAEWQRRHGDDPAGRLSVARRRFDEAGMACWASRCA